MIEKVDSQIEQWIKETVGNITVSFNAPDALPDGRGINCYLLDLVDDPPMRGPQRTPNRLSLRYLITTWAGEVAEAHRLLGILAFATINHTEFDAHFEPIEPTIWTAFGVKPLPSFILAAPLRQERPDPDVLRVREPLSILTSPLADLYGIVSGPNDELISGAKIQVPTLNRSTITDRHGRFHFSALPAEPPISRLIVRFKGQETPASITGMGTEEEPVLIQVDLFHNLHSDRSSLDEERV